MLEDSENSLEHRINEVAKAGWETAKEILTEVAGEYVKNKIGVNIVETFQSEKTGIDNQKFKFDKMFAFKKTLDETREKLKRMSEIKTVVIVVDELLKARFIRFLITFTSSILRKEGYTCRSTKKYQNMIRKI